MLSLINRGRIKDLAVLQEFEHLISRLRGFLSQSFDEDGNLIVADPNNAIVPLGGIIPFAGTTAPTGWLLCDGSQVNRVAYKSLFDLVGTTYGVGDGSTTFNIPDMRQRFPLGKAASGTGATLGSTGGNIDHTHTLSGGTSADGAHSHNVSGHVHGINNDGSHSHSQGAHQHAVNTVSGGQAGGDYSAGGGSTQIDIFNDSGTSTNGDHDHGGSTSSAGSVTDAQGAHSHSIAGSSTAANPPFVALNYIIFAGV